MYTTTRNQMEVTIGNKIYVFHEGKGGKSDCRLCCFTPDNKECKDIRCTSDVRKDKKTGYWTLKN